jgi:hypothetical protein
MVGMTEQSATVAAELERHFQRSRLIYRHYAPDATHGAELVERAFGRGGNRGGILSESQGNPGDLKPL